MVELTLIPGVDGPHDLPVGETDAPSLARVPEAPRQIGGRARPIAQVPGDIAHALAEGRYQTPLRYPGAKTGLARLIRRLLDAGRGSSVLPGIDLLVEPFAGGASTSLRLLGQGTVGRALLADADPLVAAFWQVASAEPERLIDRMDDEPVTLERWHDWRAWSPKPGTSQATARFEAATKCLFLNRTTFSGILHGRAGPIGGQNQASEYKIDCRFNKEALAERIRYVGHLYAAHRIVDVWCRDWKDTLDGVASVYKTLVPDRVVAYLDPPYLEKSAKLYQRSFDPTGGYASAPVSDLDWTDHLLHQRLADHLNRQVQYRWVLSYDSHPALLRSGFLYRRDRMTPTDETKTQLGVREWRISKRLVSLRYTASAKAGRGPAEELLLTTLPPSTVPVDEDFRLP